MFILNHNPFQVRHYGKVRMPDNLLLRVQKVHKPAVMKSNIENLNKEEQIIEKRKLWAKYLNLVLKLIFERILSRIPLYWNIYAEYMKHLKFNMSFL